MRRSDGSFCSTTTSSTAWRLHALAELSAFDAVLVTKGLAQERQDMLRNANVRLQVVDWEEHASNDS